MPQHLRPALATLAALLAASASFADPPAPTPPSAPAPAASKAADAKLYKEEAGPFIIRSIDESWTDISRTPARVIPVRIFLPERKPDPAADLSPATRFPVIIFSPGLGGSRINYAYFARHLAGHGYVVIVLSHAGSDTEAALEWLKTHGEPPPRKRPLDRLGGRTKDDNDPALDDRPGGWLMSSINDPNNLRDRPRDISFVIDKLLGHPTLGSIVDGAHIGVAGHSFGAYTAMAVAGMSVDLPTSYGGAKQSFRDKRIRAVLPMSPEGTGAMGIIPGAWDSFDAPVLFLTGTRDYGAGGRSASWRHQAFEAVHGVDDFLFTLDAAGHMTFGRPDAPHSALIRSLGTAFFDAYVRDDAAAKRWLQAFATSTPPGCMAEFKPAKSDK